MYRLWELVLQLKYLALGLDEHRPFPRKDVVIELVSEKDVTILPKRL